MKLKEFTSRWREGIREVTPLQHAKVQYRSTWLMIFGILAGIVITFLAIKTLWWLTIILIAALINTTLSQIGSWQKINVLKNYERMRREAEDD